jgi:hypothetical protein
VRFQYSSGFRKTQLLPNPKVTAGGSALFSIGFSLPAAKGGKHSIVKTRSMALIVCAARYQTTRWIPITLTKDIV